MTRIGMVTTSFPRFAGDAAGHFVEAHAQALRARGYAVDIVAADDRDAPLFYRGGAPDALEREPLRAAAHAAAFSARLLARVVRAAPRWDAIIAHWIAPSALAALPTRPPLLAIAHGGDIYTLRRLGLLAPALHALRLRDARLAFVSAELRDVARADTRSPTLRAYLDAAIVQPMGVDLARFAAMPRAPTTPPRIVIAGRLTPIKGVDVAIAASAQLHIEAQIRIYGEGPASASLHALAGARARGSPRITFVGEVPTGAMPDVLSRASVVVIPSRALANGRAEGTPLIALEALAAGVPVVASAIGGLRALAPAVILVPPEHPALLAAAIDHALVAPPAPATLRAAVAHLDWSQVAHVLAPTQLPA